MNLPGYEFLSAPLWLITVLHIVTLTLHFVAMNFLVGGVIVMLFGKVNDKWNNPVVKKFLKLFPSAMAATVTFGVAPLLFLQLTYHRQAYAASIVSGWFWLMIIAVAIVVYYFLYASAFAEKKVSRIPIYLSLALVGFLYISFVYSSVFSMAENPTLYTSIYAHNQSGALLNPEFGSYIFRWLHMLLGAVTVGAFFIGWLGKEDTAIWKLGKASYLWGMVAAMIVGLIYLMQLGDYIKPFMRSAGIYWLTLSIILSLGSLHFFFKKKMLPAAAMLFVSLLGMVVVRHVVRLLHLSDVFEPSSLTVQPQWGVFVLFLICFVIAIAIVWYMLRLFFSKAKA